MTGLAARLGEMAARLLVEYGRPVTLRQIARAAPDPAEPWRQDESVTETAVNAHAMDFTAVETDGTTIAVGDCRFLIAADGLASAPVPSDRIDDPLTGLWLLRHVRTLSIAGQPVAYELHVRR